MGTNTDFSLLPKHSRVEYNEISNFSNWITIDEDMRVNLNHNLIKESFNYHKKCLTEEQRLIIRKWQYNEFSLIRDKSSGVLQPDINKLIKLFKLIKK